MTLPTQTRKDQSEWKSFSKEYPEMNTIIFIKGCNHPFFWQEDRLTWRGVMPDEYWRYATRDEDLEAKRKALKPKTARIRP